MELNSAVVGSLVTCLITVVYYFIKGGTRKNGAAKINMQKIAEQIRELHAWHAPVAGELKWYTKEGVARIGDKVDELRAKNSEDHMKLTYILESIVKVLERQ